MKYIIMCGGTYGNWEDTPKHLAKVGGEAIVERTIRLLREAGISNICISANDERFKQFGVPVLEHTNTFKVYTAEDCGEWVEAFYPTDEPACYLMGDVFYSPGAIEKIVETKTDDIEFFASAPPFADNYIKPWAEPIAFKVVNQKHLREAIETVKHLHTAGVFRRNPVAWELWQVIKNTPLNMIITNYTVINDYTCDIDSREDAAKMEAVLRGIDND